MISFGLQTRSLLRGCTAFRRHESQLRFLDGVSRVVVRIGFVVCAIVGNPPDDCFDVVTAGESSFRIGPVGFRLTSVSRRHSASWFVCIREMARCVG